MLRKPTEKLPRQRKQKRVDPSSPPREALVGESGEVFRALREWRKSVAREHGVPAYTVFHDATLQEIARLLPGSLEKLSEISGIGTAKLERYGEPLLKIVRESPAATG
jgi:ATP-dependent DNA helicase RecQ